jgi:hypothetical protein
MNSHFDAIVDISQTAAIIGVMVVLAYGVYLLRIELRAGTKALHAIVRAQERISERLDRLEDKQ